MSTNWSEELVCFSNIQLVETMEEARDCILANQRIIKLMEAELDRRADMELPPTLPDVSYAPCD
jgi:hypothetical protein